MIANIHVHTCAQYMIAVDAVLVLSFKSLFPRGRSCDSDQPAHAQADLNHLNAYA